jgi:predicted ArsR family transcriptional regulator
MMHEVRNANGGEGRVGERTKPDWTFLTNHSHVLVCIAEAPDVRGRDIAERVGITERAAQSIIRDLVDAGYVTRTREGRRNRYTINADGHLRHPLQEDHTVGELLVALGRLRPRRRRSA